MDGAGARRFGSPGPLWPSVKVERMSRLTARDWLIIAVVSVAGGAVIVTFVEIFWPHP